MAAMTEPCRPDARLATACGTSASSKDAIAGTAVGHNTYEEMAEFWPRSDDAYAAPMNDIPRVVFSRTPERADSRIARGELAEEIAGLKREPGKDMIAWGGAAFAQCLAGWSSSTSTAASCNRWPWTMGFPCSRASRRRCRSSSSTRRHATRARRCTSTAARLRPPDQPRTRLKR